MAWEQRVWLDDSGGGARSGSAGSPAHVPCGSETPRRVRRADSCDVDGDDVAGNRKPDDEGREFDRKGRNRTRVLRGVSSEEALVWGWKT